MSQQKYQKYEFIVTLFTSNRRILGGGTTKSQRGKSRGSKC